MTRTGCGPVPCGTPSGARPFLPDRFALLFAGQDLPAVAAGTPEDPVGLADGGHRHRHPAHRHRRWTGPLRPGEGPAAAPRATQSGLTAPPSNQKSSGESAELIGCFPGAVPAQLLVLVVPLLVSPRSSAVALEKSTAAAREKMKQPSHHEPCAVASGNLVTRDTAQRNRVLSPRVHWGDFAVIKGAIHVHRSGRAPGSGARRSGR